MFQLALRMWAEGQMIYPVKFSVMYDPDKNKSSVRAFIKDKKFITFDYMLITPFSAINGQIFEKDIIIVDGDDSSLKIVNFDSETGTYIAKSVNDDTFIKMDNLHKYEVAGNIYEDKDLLSETIKKEENIEEKIEKPIVDVNPNKETDKETSEETNKEIDDVADNSVDSIIEKKEEILEEKIEEPIEEEINIIKNITNDVVKMDIHFISVFGNAGKGGYSFTFDVDGMKDTYKGSEEKTSAKKIDLSGICAALEMLEGDFEVRIFTNSQYVVYPFIKGWIYKWHDANWVKDDNEKVQNYELWSQLFDYSQKYNIKWEFVTTPTEDMKECEKFAKEEIS